VAALPGRFRQHLADGFLESGAVVGDDELDPRQAPPLQARDEVFLVALAFPVREFHRQHLALPIPVDPDGDLNRPGFPRHSVAG